MKIKAKNKRKISEWVKNKMHIKINPSALYDVMIKRIHEYKR
jgi:starch phosphorylase